MDLSNACRSRVIQRSVVYILFAVFGVETDELVLDSEMNCLE